MFSFIIRKELHYNNNINYLVLFASETAAFRETGLAAGRRAQNRRAALARHRGLCVREDRRDCIAARTLHVHEIAVRVLDEPLQFVGTFLFLRSRMEQIDG